MTRVIVLLAIVLAPFHNLYVNLIPVVGERAGVVRQLQEIPGEHLVIVRYSPDHDPQEEWVHNTADIDHSKIVWAREIPGLPLDPLLNYFRGRQIWLLEPDNEVPTVSPYHTGQVSK